jgi:hypothetical protein
MFDNYANYVESENGEMKSIPAGEHAGAPAPSEPVSGCCSQAVGHTPDEEEDENGG